jgi:CRISPR system Cascade subunit CasD
MQSWGTASRHVIRHTDLEPSKSGVIGLLCAALGRDRASPVDDLAAMRMGVRVDREGTVKCDYQTAMGVRRANEGREERGRRAAARGRSASARRRRDLHDPRDATEQTWRFYLADAAFLVGLESPDRALLERLHEALRNPRWALFLGRKSYLPSPPVWIPNGIVDKPLEKALAEHEPLVDTSPSPRRYVLEEERGAPPPPLSILVRRMDQPAGPFARRMFAERRSRIVPAEKERVPHVPVQDGPEPA